MGPEEELSAETVERCVFLRVFVVRAAEAVRAFVIWREDGGVETAFWTSADVPLLAGESSFPDAAGVPQLLQMTCCEVPEAGMLKSMAGLENVPEFPAGGIPAGEFVAAGAVAGPETSAKIRALLAFYQRDYGRLAAAAAERERLAEAAARAAVEAPPAPVILRFWRTDAPAETSKDGKAFTEGGAR